MAIEGSRFDPEVIRREAEAAREKAKQRKMIALAVNVTVFVVLAVVAKVGWDYWQGYRAEQERVAEERRIAEERAKAEAAKKKAAQEQEAKARREAEIAKQKAERERREAERLRVIREREETRRRQDEERRRLDLERSAMQIALKKAQEETKVRKAYVDKAMAALPLSVFDHLAVRKGLDDRLDVSVDDKLWNEVSEAVTTRQALDLFELIRGTTVTNEFSPLAYPDRETFDRMVGYLNSRTFHLIIRPRESIADLKGLTLVAADAKKGLATPAEAREIKNNAGRVTGWTVPFVFGDGPKIFLMESTAVANFNREWRKTRYKVKGDEVAAALDAFAESVRMELSHPLPVEKVKKEAPKEVKPKATFNQGKTSRRPPRR